jgi:hypothetical protein
MLGRDLRSQPLVPPVSSESSWGTAEPNHNSSSSSSKFYIVSVLAAAIAAGAQPSAVPYIAANEQNAKLNAQPPLTTIDSIMRV